MKNRTPQRSVYRAPELREYGDIGKITAQASGYPGALDSLYYLGYFNNLGGAAPPTDPNFTFS